MMLMQRMKDAFDLSSLKEDIEAIIIEKFVETTGLDAVQIDSMNKHSWLTISDGLYAVPSKNAGLLIKVIDQRDKYLWEYEVPVEGQYQSLLDIAACELDSMYIAVLCGTNLWFKKIDRDQELIDVIIKREARKRETPFL